MFTVCPGCTKQFRLNAEQIAAASGQVRCGFCHIQFNALEHLYDEPLANENKINSILPDQVLAGEPQFNISGHEQAELDEPGLTEPEHDIAITLDEVNMDQVLAGEPQFNISGHDQAELDEPGLTKPEHDISITLDEGNIDQVLVGEPQLNISGHDEPKLEDLDKVEADVLITDNEANGDQELNTAINEIGIRSSVEEVKIESQNEAIEDKKSEAVELHVAETHYDFPEGEELLIQSPVKRSWILSLFWSTACFVALVTITLQFAWFNRDLVLKKTPQLTPYVKQICEKLDCRLIRQRDASAIKLINRDVRLHPGYQDTLLVNATMKNELPVRQPYPRVQLTLFDTSGSLIGHREFVPGDYLDNSIEIDKGMPVDNPVHFVLEVSGPTAGAVSFEFRFL